MAPLLFNTRRGQWWGLRRSSFGGAWGGVDDVWKSLDYPCQIVTANMFDKRFEFGLLPFIGVLLGAIIVGDMMDITEKLRAWFPWLPGGES